MSVRSKINTLYISASLLVGCGDMKAGLKFTEDLTSSAYPACVDDSLNAIECRTQKDRYVTASAGNDVVVSGATSMAIPAGYYDGNKTAVVSDMNLDPSNIKAGTTILGVTGVMTTSAYDACSDNSLNGSPCSTGSNRYVTSTLGSNVTISGALSALIPQGFYDGTKSANVVDGNIVASNIRTGTSILGVSGSLVPSAPACTDNGLNASSCTTANNRYVASTLGGNVTVSGGLNATIPAGYQDGSKSCTISDAQLVAGNIRSGTTVLGITGTMTTSAYDACTDNVLNAAQCSTAPNRYVSSVLGGNVTGASGARVITIPAGYYDGSKTTTANDTNLVAANIKSGVTIFGVGGSLTTPSNCTGNGQQGCVTTGSYYAGEWKNTAWFSANSSTTSSSAGYYNGVGVDTSTIDASKIQIGTTMFGKAGTLSRPRILGDWSGANWPYQTPYQNYKCNDSGTTSYITISGASFPYPAIACAYYCKGMFVDMGNNMKSGCAHFNSSTTQCRCHESQVATTSGATSNDWAMNFVVQEY
ncbi:hypothetical protein [Bdellovibrio sp.]|uniref:hypothetical protein n=1 Tax=Bdellovibrio sp. TaxID=28201 RepID=UPI0039E4CC0F